MKSAVSGQVEVGEEDVPQRGGRQIGDSVGRVALVPLVDINGL